LIKEIVSLLPSKIIKNLIEIKNEARRLAKGKNQLFYFILKTIFCIFHI